MNEYIWLVQPILEIMKTVLGVFVGAMLAFRLNRLTQEQLKRDDQREAAILVSLTLSRLWNDYKNFSTSIAEHKVRLEKLHPGMPSWDKLPVHLPLPTFPKAFEEIKFEFSSLPFLFGIGYESLLGELHMCQERYANFTHFVTEYNAAHVEAHRQVIEKFGAMGEAPMSEIEKSLGPVLYLRLEFLAGAVLTSIEKDMAHIRRVNGELEVALSRHFGPGVKYMKLRFDEK